MKWCIIFLIWNEVSKVKYKIHQFNSSEKPFPNFELELKL